MAFALNRIAGLFVEYSVLQNRFPDYVGYSPVSPTSCGEQLGLETRAWVLAICSCALSTKG